MTSSHQDMDTTSHAESDVTSTSIFSGYEDGTAVSKTSNPYDKKSAKSWHLPTEEPFDAFENVRQLPTGAEENDEFSNFASSSYAKFLNTGLVGDSHQSHQAPVYKVQVQYQPISSTSQTEAERRDQGSLSLQQPKAEPTDSSLVDFDPQLKVFFDSKANVTDQEGNVSKRCTNAEALSNVDNESSNVEMINSYADNVDHETENDEQNNSEDNLDTGSSSNTNVSVKTFNCSVCDKALPSAFELHYHELQFHDVSQTCSKCGVTLTTAGRMIKHQFENCVKMARQCTQCGQVFTNPQDLLKHLYRHEEQLRNQQKQLRGICLEEEKQMEQKVAEERQQLRAIFEEEKRQWQEQMMYWQEHSGTYTLEEKRQEHQNLIHELQCKGMSEEEKEDLQDKRNERQRLRELFQGEMKLWRQRMAQEDQLRIYQDMEKRTQMLQESALKVLYQQEKQLLQQRPLGEEFQHVKAMLKQKTQIQKEVVKWQQINKQKRIKLARSQFLEEKRLRQQQKKQEEEEKKRQQWQQRLQQMQQMQRMRAEAEETKVQCEVCGKQLKNIANLRNHMKYHSDLRPYVCKVCGKTFKTHSYLVIHSRWHTRPYQCPHCPKAFAVKHYLKVHAASHTGSKPHVCRICGKGFMLKSYLLLHEKTHDNAGRKPFTCDVCGVGYMSQYHLSDHMLRHGTDKSFQCEFCNQQFFTERSLREHLQTHNKQHMCDLCGALFTRPGRLRRHVAAKHSLQMATTRLK